MRFAFISLMGGAPWGGSEELWSRAALQLRESGHDVAASVRSWPHLPEQLRNLKTAGIELMLRSAPAKGTIGRIWQKCSFQSLRNGLWLRNQKPDLVIFSLGANRGGSAWMKWCSDHRMPYCVVVQANAEGWWLEDGEREAMMAGYRAARTVFCVSHHNLQLLEQQLGQKLSNGKVVSNPWNVVAEFPVPWPTENGTWKLACVARLEPAAKGQDLLLEVFAQPKWQERPVELNLYGSGPCRNGLAQLAEHYELRNVRLRGHIKHVEDIWKENHLLVLPSRYEGLPLALVEAMWCGRPSVVTKVGGNAELCIDGETGFVARAPAVELLDEALERAWNRRHQWHLLGQAARRNAERCIPRDPIGDFCQELLMMSAVTPSSQHSPLPNMSVREAEQDGN